MPERAARPADLLPRLDVLAVGHRANGVDVAVAPGADAHRPVVALDLVDVRRDRDGAARDGVDAVRSVRRMAPLGSVVAYGDVDAVVEDRPEVRPARIEEAAADRVLLVQGPERPAVPDRRRVGRGRRRLRRGSGGRCGQRR